MKYISQFYDINKKTQTEQVLQNMSDIADLKDADDTLQENIDKEVQDRTDADASLAYDIDDLQHQIDGLGNVFTLKGSVATYTDLPASDNTIGDVWYVEDEAVGYVWIDDNGTERWEQLGLPIDLSDYVTTSDLALALEDYQEKLTAGTNISIIGNVISATSGNGVTLDTTTQSFEGDKTLRVPVNDKFEIEALNEHYAYSHTFEDGTLTVKEQNFDMSQTSYTTLSSNSNFLNIIRDNGSLILYKPVSSNSIGITFPSQSGTLARIGDITAGNFNSGSATNGQVLTADGSGGASWQNGGSVKVKTILFTDLLVNLTDLNTIFTTLNAQTDAHCKTQINALSLDNTYDEIHVDLGCLAQYGASIYDGDMVFKKCMQSTVSGNANQWVCSLTIYAMGDTIINKNTFYISVQNSATYGAMALIHEYLS